MSARLFFLRHPSSPPQQPLNSQLTLFSFVVSVEKRGVVTVLTSPVPARRLLCSFVLLSLLVVVCSSLALALQATVTPGTIRMDVQAGGYANQPIEITTDGPAIIMASAPKALAGLLKLTRHNDSLLVLHVMPPYIDGNYEAEGTLDLVVQGQQPLTSASAQRVSIPINISIRVNGKAAVPSVVSLGKEETIDIVPLSNEGATLLAVVIIGVIALNIVLRQRVKGKDNGRDQGNT